MTGQLVGSFRLVRLPGEGGMSSVYLGAGRWQRAPAHFATGPGNSSGAIEPRSAAAGVLLVALVAGVGRVLWQSIRAQRSRAVAETRFEDASKLTGSLLVDFYASVQKLDRSGPLQQALVERSRETLDRLAAQSGNDTALALNLADTYWKLGQLEKNPNDAIASFDRGLALVDGVLRRNDHNRGALSAKTRLLEAKAQASGAANPGRRPAF